MMGTRCRSPRPRLGARATVTSVPSSPFLANMVWWTIIVSKTIVTHANPASERLSRAGLVDCSVQQNYKSHLAPRYIKPVCIYIYTHGYIVYINVYIYIYRHVNCMHRHVCIYTYIIYIYTYFYTHKSRVGNCASPAGVRRRRRSREWALPRRLRVRRRLRRPAS